MSLPLKDFRLPIPESVHLWLEAEASAFGKDKADTELDSKRVHDGMTLDEFLTKK